MDSNISFWSHNTQNNLVLSHLGMSIYLNNPEY